MKQPELICGICDTAGRGCFDKNRKEQHRSAQSGTSHSVSLQCGSKFKCCVILQNEPLTITASSKESGQLLYSQSEVFITRRQPILNVIICYWAVIELWGHKAMTWSANGRFIWEPKPRILTVEYKTRNIKDHYAVQEGTQILKQKSFLANKY